MTVVVKNERYANLSESVGSEQNKAKYILGENIASQQSSNLVNAALVNQHPLTSYKVVDQTTGLLQGCKYFFSSEGRKEQKIIEKHSSKSTPELHVFLCFLRPGHEQCCDHTVQSFLPRWLSEEMALRPGDVSTLPLATEEPNGIRPQPRCLCSQSEHRSCSHEWGEKRRSTSRPGEWRGRCKSCHISWRELLRPDPEHFITINFSPIYCDGITYLCFLILFLTPESSRSWPLVLTVSGTEKDPCRGFVLCILKARPASFYFRWPVSHALPLSLLGGSRTQQPRMHIQTNNHN